MMYNALRAKKKTKDNVVLRCTFSYRNRSLANSKSTVKKVISTLEETDGR